MNNIHLTARTLREDLKDVCVKLNNQILQEPASLNRSRLVIALENIIDADFQILQVYENSSYNAFPECDKFDNRIGREVKNEDIHCECSPDRGECFNCGTNLL